MSNIKFCYDNMNSRTSEPDYHGNLDIQKFSFVYFKPIHSAVFSVKCEHFALFDYIQAKIQLKTHFAHSNVICLKIRKNRERSPGCTRAVVEKTFKCEKMNSAYFQKSKCKRYDFNTNSSERERQREGQRNEQRVRCEMARERLTSRPRNAII